MLLTDGISAVDTAEGMVDAPLDDSGIEVPMDSAGSDGGLGRRALGGGAGRASDAKPERRTGTHVDEHPLCALVTVLC